MFCRFVNLDISESIPDQSTFWRFRKKLDELSLMDQSLNEINQQLSEQGLYIKSGEVSIVDTSVIQVNSNRLNKRKDGSSTQGCEADWNVKAGSDGKRKSSYGFKAHINLDEDGIIKPTDNTKESVHDSNCFTNLLSGKEFAVYADSAYLSQVHNDWLFERSIEKSCRKTRIQK